MFRMDPSGAVKLDPFDVLDSLLNDILCEIKIMVSIQIEKGNPGLCDLSEIFIMGLLSVKIWLYVGGVFFAGHTHVLKISPKRITSLILSLFFRI